MIYLDTREAAERFIANGIDSDLADIRKLGADGDLTSYKLDNNHTVVTEISVANYIRNNRPNIASGKRSRKLLLSRYFRHLSIKLKRPAKYPYTATLFLLIPIVLFAVLLVYVIGSQASKSALPVMVAITLAAYIFTLLLVFVLEDLSATSVKWQGVTASGASAVFFGLLSVFTFIYWEHAPIYQQLSEKNELLQIKNQEVIKGGEAKDQEKMKREEAEKNALVADGKVGVITENYLALVDKLPSVLSHEKIEIPMELKLKLTCFGVDSPETFHYSRRDFNATNKDNYWDTSEYPTNEALIPMEDSKAEFLIHKNKSIYSGAVAQVYIDSSTLLKPNVTVSIASSNGLCDDVDKKPINITNVESILKKIGDSGGYTTAANLNNIDLLADDINGIEDDILKKEIFVFLLRRGANNELPSSESALHLLSIVKGGWIGDDLGADIGLLRDSAHSISLVNMVFGNHQSLGLQCNPVPIGGNASSWGNYSECLKSINFSQYNHPQFSDVVANRLIDLGESRLMVSILAAEGAREYSDETLGYFNSAILLEEKKKRESGDVPGQALTPRLSDALFGAALTEFIDGEIKSAKLLLERINLVDDRAIDMRNYNSIAGGIHSSVSPLELRKMLLSQIDLSFSNRSERVKAALSILGTVKGPIPQIIFFNQKRSFDEANDYKLRIIDSMVKDQKDVVESFPFFAEAASYSVLETPLPDGKIGFNVVLKSKAHVDEFTFDRACAIRRDWLESKFEVVEVKGATTTECEV